MTKLKLLFEDEEPVLCPRCGTGNIKKYGHRYNKYSVKQRYRCYECGMQFLFNNEDIRKVWYPKEMILFVLGKIKKSTYKDTIKAVKKKFNREIPMRTLTRINKRYKGRDYVPREEREIEIKKICKKYRGKIFSLIKVKKIFGYSQKTRLVRTMILNQGYIKRIKYGYYEVL